MEAAGPQRGATHHPENAGRRLEETKKRGRTVSFHCLVSRGPGSALPLTKSGGGGEPGLEGLSLFWGSSSVLP